MKDAEIEFVSPEIQTLVLNCLSYDADMRLSAESALQDVTFEKERREEPYENIDGLYERLASFSVQFLYLIFISDQIQAKEIPPYIH